MIPKKIKTNKNYKTWKKMITIEKNKNNKIVTIQIKIQNIMILDLILTIKCEYQLILYFAIYKYKFIL